MQSTPQRRCQQLQPEDRVTLAGLAAARARGRSGGRPGIAPKKLAALESLAADPTNKPGEICKALGISRATFYKYAPDRSKATSASGL